MDSIRRFFENMKDGITGLFGRRRPDTRKYPAAGRGRTAARGYSSYGRRDAYASRGRMDRGQVDSRGAYPHRQEPAAHDRQAMHDENAEAEPRKSISQQSNLQNIDHADFTRPAQPDAQTKPQEPAQIAPQDAPLGAGKPFYAQGFSLWARRNANEAQGAQTEDAANAAKMQGAQNDGQQTSASGGEAPKGAESPRMRTGFTGPFGRVGWQGDVKLPGEEYSVDRLRNRWAHKEQAPQIQPAANAMDDTRAFERASETDEARRGFRGLFQTREKPPNALLGVAFTTLQLVIFVVLALGVIGVGAVVGVARAYTDTAPVLDVSKIQNQDLTSFIYDGNGNLITTFAGAQNRVWAPINEIPVNLQNAFISIEDSRFRTHNGVDIKRIVGAFLSNMGSDATQGGSTITQQLIKNTLGSPDRTYKRKIQEAWLAMQLEHKYTKDQILEAYLNTIPLGESDYGVKATAQDYFGKPLDQLTLRECAMIAGLTQSPYLYDPRLNMYKRNRMDITNKRTDTVLLCMYQQGYINKQQYEAALQDTVTIQQTGTQTQMYDMPYFVEYAMDDITAHLLKSRNLEDTPENRGKIDTELRTGGYKIYLSVDPDIQKIVEDTLYNWTKYPKMQLSSYGTYNGLPQPQAAAAVVDYHTGQLKAIVGGRQQPTAKRTLNRAYQAHEPVGSAIKPIAVYAPALDTGMSPASIIYNVPAPIQGWGTSQGYPSNFSGDPFTGPTSMRTGLIHSYNVVAAHLLLDDVGLDNSYNTLMKLGIKQTSSNNIKKDGPGLALGTSGITPIEMAGAYGTFGNEGQYVEPLSFTKIVDSKGNTVLDADQIRTKTQVYKPSTAYMMVDMMQDVVSKGTGTKAKLSGMNVAGKTGTNSDYRGVSFCALTPYYSADVWVGSDDYKPLYKGATGGSDAAPIWKAFMQKIDDTKGLKNKDIIPDSAASLGLERVTVCGVSGQLLTDACALDTQYPPIKDWFLKGTEPTSPCAIHAEKDVDKTSGKYATPFCPAEDIQPGFVEFFPTTSIVAKMKPEDFQKYFPNGVITDDPTQFTYDNPLYAQYFCTVHTQGWSDIQTQYDTLVSQANGLVGDVKQKMNAEPWLTQDVKDKLNGLIDTVNGYIQKGFSDPLESPLQVYDNLLGAYNNLKNYEDQVLGPTAPPTESPPPTNSPTNNP